MTRPGLKISRGAPFAATDGRAPTARSGDRQGPGENEMQRPHNAKTEAKVGKGMRTINLCAIVIAASTFAMAVEYVYGWSNVKPLTEDTWNTISQWSDGVVGETETARSVDAS
jgi:hypothetical protein